MDDILTVAEVALRLKVADRTVYAMLAAGEMPGFKIRGQWRLRREAFETWLDALSSSGASPAPAVSLVKPAPPMEPAIATTSEERPFLTPRLTVEDMHRKFVGALGDQVVSHSDLAKKPLDLDLAHPLPRRVRLYLFNATRPAGGRPVGEHKIQLILPDQKRGARGKFAHDDGRFVILAGYAAEDEVFALWDAGLYDDFAYSRNVQIKAETITAASIGTVAEQLRMLRPKGADPTTEIVLASDTSHLGEALVRRSELTVSRLQED
ncbi:helix-turn-helix domain-containing protein [Devosia sp. LjRoot16]|uniref:helix-turn-helix domain-containing protein n=1 Tax=Devosia sp. LjRoot16 TaxID=3342271 RepID=UPI003F4F8F75